MKDLDISAVSRRTGIAASTLRYYEERGLIRSIGRKGLKRLFDPDVVDRLALIALGRASGFSLDEIAGMLPADGPAQIDRDRLSHKADALDRTIQQLTAMRDGLRHAVECRAPSHMECPTFQRLVRIAARGAFPPAPHGL
jgi:MerR family redox-sensitive transcriptional activator SoxR